MKRFLFLILIIPVFSFSQYTAIPDENFERVLIRLGCDDNLFPDGKVPTNKIDTLEVLDVRFKVISDLTGIEAFTYLTKLDCSSTLLTSLDVSKNTALTYLDCSSTLLTSLDVSKNTALTYLDCEENQLTSLDLSKNSALTYLRCSNNELTSLDLSNNTALKYLGCSKNNFDCDALKAKYNIKN